MAQLPRASSISIASQVRAASNSERLHELRIARRTTSSNWRSNRSAKSTPSSPKVPVDEQAEECCVCFFASEVCTPCGHSLCRKCWDRLPKPSCPMCRRELPSSAAAMPAWLVKASHKGASFLPELPRGGRRSPGPRSASPRPTCRTAARPLHGADAVSCDFKPLPSRLAQQMRSLSQSRVLTQSQFKDALRCAEALVSLRSAQDSPQYEAATTSCKIVSEVVARTLAEMPLDDLACVVADCDQAIRRGELLPEVVLRGLRAGVIRSVQQEGSDTLPDALHMRWNEAEAFVKHVVAMGKHDSLQPVVLDVAPYATRLVFDIVKLSPLGQLPIAIRRGQLMLEPWPAAALNFVAALRSWLPAQLQELMARWAEVDNVPPPTLPPSGSRRSPGRNERLPVGASPAWRQTLWWLEVLRTAAIAGVLENTNLAAFCTQLAPQLLEEGVRIAPAQALLLAIGTGHFASDLGDQFNPRHLANELARRPKMVRYMPSTKLIVLDCPGDDGASSESIILSR